VPRYALKQKLRYFTVEKVDDEIVRLEEHHAHTSMSLQEAGLAAFHSRHFSRHVI
jgi:hypothetical protein